MHVRFQITFNFQVIQTISRTDKFSEEQKNLLGLAAANLTAAVTVSSEVSTISNAITTIGSTNAAVPPNMFAKLTADPLVQLNFMPYGEQQ